MDIRVIPICIMLFWLAGKMTRMQPTKGPAAACTGQCGLLLGLLLSAVPISDLTDSDLCMYVCWKCGYPIPGNLMKEKAGNGLANTSLQGGVRSLCITSSAGSVGSLSPGSYWNRNSQITVFCPSDKDRPWRHGQYLQHVTHIIFFFSVEGQPYAQAGSFSWTRITVFNAGGRSSGGQSWCILGELHK